MVINGDTITAINQKQTAQILKDYNNLDQCEAERLLLHEAVDSLYDISIQQTNCILQADETLQKEQKSNAECQDLVKLKEKKEKEIISKHNKKLLSKNIGIGTGTAGGFGIGAIIGYAISKFK